ncbi:UNVERIFIED_CONTAM: Dolichyl-diphosphooligosaccharide--protein glycosyltransferase subunit DAD1 [Sesamum radiatum]|uniref:Dolichyl-diphosphooligosaccharide--protein glycosyltransferase subunit DAD1 n=1 Tax=Sesamum radiatum TaxID=300843 RepID=A0AAW2TW62_SESRA
MGRSATTKDAQALFHSLRSAYAATPNNLKIIDLYIVFAVVTAVIQLRARSKAFFLVQSADLMLGWA